MASETSINGHYAPHQGYGSLDQNHTGYSTSQTTYPNPPSSTSATNTAAATSANAASDIPKDEVGWYFVEQYYTTLSRSPEKLYLFYNKRSQFVSGNETEKVDVCVGQRSINDRIKDLDFQDCKVRVTNVDSQASDENIVIQVIGEISNKSAPHKKFTQTFVLAGQTNGYFVLNDIFRYIIEEEDEVETEQAQQQTLDVSAPQEPEPVAAAAAAAAAPEPEAQPEPQTLTSSEDPVAIEEDAAKVDRELKEKVLNEQESAKDVPAAEPSAVNGSSKPDTEPEVAVAEDAPVAAVGGPAEETAASEPSKEEIVQPEKPKDPEPTPVLSPRKSTPAQPAASAAPSKPAVPAMPKTWATLAAAAAQRVATPAVPVPQAAAAPSAAQPKQPTPAQTQAAPAAPAASAPVDTAQEHSPATSQQEEWTSVGGDHKRQQSKAQAGAGAQEGAQNRAYIKNVNDNIDAKDLRQTLEKFGEIVYFDIARQKNCAFVDFKTAEGYKAAVEANPHQIGNERIIVEERRVKPGSYPYVPRGGARGNRGAPSQGPGRGQFQGRGGFPQRGGRGNNASRGRGGVQAA